MTSTVHITLLAGEPKGTRKRETPKKQEEEGHNKTSVSKKQSSEREKTAVLKNS